MKAIHSWRTLVLFISLLPSLAFALAGIAESTSFFYYNDYTKIERGHPSDLCWGPDQWCLAFRKDGYQGFKDINFTFKQVSVPADKAIPYFIGQRLSDDSWLIYDLQKEKPLIADIDYQKVIAVWLSLGLARPVYVNARNTRELLTETEDSVADRWSINLQMWFFMGILPVTPVVLIFWYLSRKSRQQYRKANSKVFLVFTYVFLVPVFALIYVAISSFIGVIRYNW
jgi:hypothetical protein